MWSVSAKQASLYLLEFDADEASPFWLFGVLGFPCRPDFGWTEDDDAEEEIGVGVMVLELIIGELVNCCLLLQVLEPGHEDVEIVVFTGEPRSGTEVTGFELFWLQMAEYFPVVIDGIGAMEEAGALESLFIPAGNSWLPTWVGIDEITEVPCFFELGLFFLPLR